MVIYMVVGKKRKNGTRNGQKTKKISMTKLKDDIERMNEKLLRMEARAGQEKNKAERSEIIRKLGNIQWDLVQKLKKKYGFELEKIWNDSNGTVLILKKRNTVVRTVFGYPSEIANNSIGHFFEIEKK